MVESSSKNSQIRTFFALRLRDPIVRQLANCADSLAVYDKKVEVDWVDSEHYHLTLCFLGALSITKVEEISLAAQKYLAAEKSLNIHLEGLGSFQSESNWTLLVAKTANSPELEALHSLVSCFVHQAGIQPEQVDFRPHITLGRIQQGHSFQIPDRWPVFDLYSLADAVVLFQSKTGGRGSVYTPLSIVELKDLA